MGRKFGIGVIIALNIIGIICLAYFAIPYLTHDTVISNPDAMLPMERWDSGGMALIIGLVPLAVVNILALLFVGKAQIKKPVKALFMFPCIICLGIVAHYLISSVVGAGLTTAFSEPVVKVRVEWKDDSEIQYGLLYDNGGMKLLGGAFASDGVNVFVADTLNFSYEIEKNRVVNRVVGTSVTDGQGNRIEADDTVQSILRAVAADIDHAILEAKIFEDGQEYFVAVQLNVNWQSPCDFYRYDADAGKLEFLYSWDNADVQQISVYGEE